MANAEPGGLFRPAGSMTIRLDDTLTRQLSGGLTD